LDFCWVSTNDWDAVNDPKVRHELGDGGAPPEAAIRMKALSVKYCKMAQVLTGMGFIGAVLDVKLPKAKKAVVYKVSRSEAERLLITSQYPDSMVADRIKSG
jgi:hypothetical protein